MLQFQFRRGLKGVHLAALRIDSRHHVLDGAIFSSRIHGLKDQKNRPAVLGIELILQLRRAGDAQQQSLLGMLLGFPMPRVRRIKIFQAEMFPTLHSESLRQLVSLHRESLSCT